MKWSAEDIKSYIEAKEYVDTAIIQLVPLEFGEGLAGAASAAEYIGLLATQLERQFTGRVLLLPPFTYLKEEGVAEAFARLSKWEERLADEGIRNIFFLTSAQEWRNAEENLNGSLIWLPALPLASIDERQKVLLVNDQVKQLMQLFTNKWRAE
ncbi:YpiF family protein [Bacillus sp. FJAT-27245]|uniref:YpiF family protein n=1 Tax=Bacillus sp. FJAT-27245 TaxID=1684144 RepID=UPI0006A7E07B|nr:YpiF family protein [Bacillus sp. FJAT-27245]